MHTGKRVIQRVFTHYFLVLFLLVALWLVLPSPLAVGDPNILGISDTKSFTRIYRTRDFPIGTDDDFFAMHFEVSPDERLVRIHQDFTPPIVVPLKNTENIATNPAIQLNVTDWIGRLANVRISSKAGIVPSWIGTGDVALLSWQLGKELSSIDLTAHYVEDKQKMASFQLTTSANQSTPLLSVHWNDNCQRPMFAVQFPPEPQSYSTSVTYQLRSIILSILWPMNLILSYAFIYTLVFFETIFGFYGIHLAIIFWSLVLVVAPLATLIGWKRLMSKLPLTPEKGRSSVQEDGKSRMNHYPEKSSLVDLEASPGYHE